MIQIIGYFAMMITISSMMIKNITKLRIVNSIGCITWSIYGIIKQDIPIIVVNLIIIVVNLYYLLWNKKN